MFIWSGFRGLFGCVINAVLGVVGIFVVLGSNKSTHSFSELGGNGVSVDNSLISFLFTQIISLFTLFIS